MTYTNIYSYNTVVLVFITEIIIAIILLVDQLSTLHLINHAYVLLLIIKVN